MKAGDLARYWAARELTRVEQSEQKLILTAPIACPGFTLRAISQPGARPQLRHKNASISLTEARSLIDLKPGTWLPQTSGIIVCFDLAQGATTLSVQA